MTDNNNNNDSDAGGTSAARSDQWKSLDSMTTKRSGAACISVNDHQFLVIGGDDGSGGYKYLRSCEYYDANTKTWNPFPDLPEGRYGSGAAMVGNKVYVLGGQTDDSSKKPTSDLVSIDVSGDDLSSALTLTTATQRGTWVKLTPMAQARRHFACVSHSKHIYVFGGSDGTSALNTAERYDTETDEWISLSAMSDKRSCCAAGCLENKIYILGGENNDKKEVSTTLVYNTSKTIEKESWDSSISGMIKPRTRLSVVVAGRYILAIGGQPQNPDIEMWDTVRRSWYNSRTPMPKGRNFLVAGLLSIKGQNEIILAGGADVSNNDAMDTAQTIYFEKGILPIQLQPSTGGRPQKIVGDTYQGRDHLDLNKIAKTFARMLVYQDLKPPFVLGILAKWGWGKSFFYNLILDELINLQKKPKDDPQVRDTYAGHIYVVKFNAWTYSKGEVMSSMMYQILKDLNEQLVFEEKIGNNLDGRVSSIAVWRDLSIGEKEYMNHVTDEDGSKEKFIEYLKDMKENGESASECLAKAINDNYEDDKEERIHIDKIIEMAKTKKESMRAAHDMMRVTNFVGRMILEKALKDAIKPAKDNEQGVEDGDNTAIDDYNHCIDGLKTSMEVTKYLCSFRVSNIPPYAFMCSAFLIVLTTVLFYWENEFTGIVTKAVTGGISILLPVITSVSSVMKQIDPIMQRLNNQDDMDEEDDNDFIKKLKVKKKANRNRTLALEGESLRNTAKNIDSKKYESKLGIVHEAQLDLKRMSESMMNPKQKNIFPRGNPRAVLFIDDLDRCKHKVVVEAIETLQLLVSTKLFVSILAIDPRYVTLSIEEKYKGILNRKNPPSGMDFLEKIIQIPFRLPGVREAHVKAFLESQLDIDDDESNDVLDTDLADVSVPSITPAAVSVPVDGPTAAPVPSAEVNHYAAPDPVPSADINKKLLCTKTEKEMLIELFKLFRVSPRSLKRIINVYKVLKLLWIGDATNQEEVDPALRRATVFLMLLASDESTRDATFKIFEWMEVGMVNYAKVIKDIPVKPQDNGDIFNLADLFKGELKHLEVDSKKLKGGSREKEGGIEGTLMAAVDEYLCGYTWKNVAGWNRISTKFWYARSFSFFHSTSTTEEIDNRSSVAAGKD